MLKYIKSLAFTSEPEYYWIGGVICFVDDGKLVFDRGFVILGKVSSDFYSYYCNFRNFTIVNGELHYHYPDKLKRIDPKKVYLHIRIGKSPFVVPIENKLYWNLYFTSPNNKIYRNLEIDAKKIRIIDEIIISNKNIKALDIKNPHFNSRHIYNEESVLFSDIKLDFLF